MSNLQLNIFLRMSNFIRTGRSCLFVIITDSHTMYLCQFIHCPMTARISNDTSQYRSITMMPQRKSVSFHLGPISKIIHRISVSSLPSPGWPVIARILMKGNNPETERPGYNPQLGCKIIFTPIQY